MKKINITLGEERIISMAPPEIDPQKWGPWQFPSLYKSEKGELFLEFHNAEDNYSSYGSKQCQYASYDLGKTWQETPFVGGLPISDGTMIRPAKLKALPVDEINLPDPVAECKYCYVKEAFLYDIDKVSSEYKKWHSWVIEGENQKIQEIKVNAPGYLMRVSHDLLITPFFYNTYFFRRDADSIIAVSYHPLLENGKTTTYFNALYFESRDDGKSFDLISTIPYLPPYDKVNESEHCQGWLEPDLCFIDENTAFSLLRTTCVKGVSAMYISWSYDGLKTWTKPEYFDDLGVFPQTVKLENGTILAGYGRPGLYVRPLYENKWNDRVAVVEPGEFQTDTCSYCALAPIDENTALIVYSRFDVKDEMGRKRKAIMCREIQVNLKE